MQRVKGSLTMGEKTQEACEQEGWKCPKGVRVFQCQEGTNNLEYVT